MGKVVKEDDLLGEALRLMTAALDLLDRRATVGSIGAQLDLARARLADHIAELEQPGSQKANELVLAGWRQPESRT